MTYSIHINDRVLELVQGDITEQDTDAIVNAANSGLRGGGGVDGAIHRAAGRLLDEECRAIIARQGRLPAGQAVITSGGNLPARHVIHTVGPIYSGNPKDPVVLADCYRNSLMVAEQENLRSVAFPSISTGAYRYPLELASVVALRAVSGFLENQARSLRIVRFVLFSKAAYDAYEQAAADLLGPG